LTYSIFISSKENPENAWINLSKINRARNRMRTKKKARNNQSEKQNESEEKNQDRSERETE
jgi:hypothetical protein